MGMGTNLRGHRHAVPVLRKVCAFAHEGLCPFVGTGANFGGHHRHSVPMPTKVCAYADESSRV